jgi:hypothetical protein
MNQQQKDGPTYVTELNTNDVLFGRGAYVTNYEGNIAFRQLASEHRAEYSSLGPANKNWKAEEEIAITIICTVTGRGGRFLKKLSDAEAKNAGYESGTTAYQLADKESVLEKVKETLRKAFPTSSTAAARAGDCLTDAQLKQPISMVPGDRGIARKEEIGRGGQLRSPKTSALADLSPRLNDMEISPLIDKGGRDAQCYNMHAQYYEQLTKLCTSPYCRGEFPHLITNPNCTTPNLVQQLCFFKPDDDYVDFMRRMRRNEERELNRLARLRRHR